MDVYFTHGCSHNIDYNITKLNAAALGYADATRGACEHLQWLKGFEPWSIQVCVQHQKE